jgi:hypothetical protein
MYHKPWTVHGRLDTGDGFLSMNGGWFLRGKISTEPLYMPGDDRTMGEREQSSGPMKPMV